MHEYTTKHNSQKSLTVCLTLRFQKEANLFALKVINNFKISEINFHTFTRNCKSFLCIYKIKP
jgi:hypothetical protein